MKAFFVHDKKKQSDMLVVPESNCLVRVNQAVMETFIAVAPDFSEHAGQNLNDLSPETFGHIVATRESDGDVCIIDKSLWQQRMNYHLGHASKSRI